MAFTLTALEDFKNLLGAPQFNADVAQGTMVSQVEQYAGRKGDQALNVWDASLTFQDGADSNTDTAFDTYNSSISNAQKNISIESEFAQAWVNPHVFDGKYLEGNVSVYGDSSSALNAGVASVAMQARKALGQKFYTGFGSAASNGLVDIITGDGVKKVDANVASLTSSNIIAAISALLDGRADETFGRNDNVVVLKPADYQAYRQAVVEGKYPQAEGNIGRETGLLMSEWIYDGSITIIGDTGHSGTPMFFQAGKTYFGTSSLGDAEAPQVWYSADKNLVGVRVFLYGGVQITEPGMTHYLAAS